MKRGPKPKDPSRRFFELCLRDPESGCWLWLGAIGRKTGYGRFWNGDEVIDAHRFSFELSKHAIPQSLWIDHLCRMRCCVNPSHLEVVTPSMNMKRSPSHGPHPMQTELGFFEYQRTKARFERQVAEALSAALGRRGHRILTEELWRQSMTTEHVIRVEVGDEGLVLTWNKEL